MDFLIIPIVWWVLSPLLRFFAHHQFLFFLLLCGGVWLYRRRRAQTSLTLAPPASSLQPPESRESSPINVANRTLIDLLILRNELARQCAAGKIDSVFFKGILKEINSLCDNSLIDLHITPDSQRWREGREAAWKLLVSQQIVVSGPPPWREINLTVGRSVETPQQLTLPLQPRASSPLTMEIQQPIALEAVTSPTQVPPTATLPPLPSESAVLLKQAPVVPPVVTENDSSPSQGDFPSPLFISNSASHSVSTDEAWVPATPSVLERTLQTVSRWPALLVPFLVQNILWFICGLCFVAGSTFLISSTSGQTNALAVSAVLLAYSGFLLWIGYRLCRARPELTSGHVLLALGLLLIPLNVASAVRLITTAQATPWIAISLLLTAAEVLGFYYVTMLVSGVMDRSLQGRHPRLFLILTATQITVPLLARYPSWIFLAITHCALLGVLAYGLRQFTHEWLQSIFTERRKVAYYAVGTLVYAAVVSFVHLTWGHTNPVILPAGYYSPFLMVVCGLLFYIDAQLKHWTKQYAFLSHVSFFLYALSILALLLSVDAPVARLLTLCLAIAVYSVVVWQYVTFIPLILLLICCGWLYQTLVLQHLPAQWYFLASFPGFVGLLAGSRWLQRHRATTLVSTCYWVWVGTTFAVCAWSLLHSHPSLVAMATALATMGLVFYGLRSAPIISNEQTVDAVHTDLRQSSWLYAVMLLGSIAVAYAPQSPLTIWVVQTAIGIIILAGLWLAMGLQLYQRGSLTSTRQAEVLLNSALVNVGFALALTVTLALPDITYYRLLPLLLAAVGIELLGLGLALRTRSFFYGALVLWGTAGVALKLTYFPQPSAGTIEMLLALSVWAALWWLEHESEESLALRQEYLTARAQGRPALTLLGRFSLSNSATYITMLRPPLQQTMVVLWAIGLWHLATQLLEGRLGWEWVCSAGLGALGATIGAGYFRLPLLFPVAVVLGLGTWLSTTFQLGFSRISDLGFAGALYSFLVWGVSTVSLRHPRTSHFAVLFHLGGKRSTTEVAVHWTAVVSSLLSVAVPILLGSLFTPSVTLFCTPLVVVMFLGVAGWQYQAPMHSYLLLGVTTLSVLLSYIGIVSPLHMGFYTLLRDHHVGLLASITGLTFWVIAWELSIQRGRFSVGLIPYLCQLYYSPLCHLALLLTVFAINQALALAWVDAPQSVDILATVTLFFAGTVLFAVSFTLGHMSLQTAGLLAAVLATLWGEAQLIHPEAGFTLWLGGSAFSDRWLTLSLVSGSLALLTYHLRQQPERQLYARPIGWAASLTYVWALCGAVVLFANASLRADLCLSLTFLTLMVGQFPLVQPLAEASTVRGFALPLLSSAFLISVLALVGLTHQFNTVALLWGFTLWAAASFMLPLWNARQSQWTIAPDAWPWFGLFTISFCLLLSFLDTPHQSRIALLHHAGYLSVGAAYLLLMLRNSNWGGFSWIAVFLLTRVGTTLISAWWAGPPFFATTSPLLLLPISPPVGELVWLNLLLLVVPWWHPHGEALAKRLGWQKHNLPHPFLLLPAGFFLVRLCHFVFLLCSNNVDSLFPAGDAQWLELFIFAGTLTFSFLHLWWQHRQTWEGHALFAALSCTALVAWFGYVSLVFNFPFFVALWSAIVCAAHFLWEKHQRGSEQTEPLRNILAQWVEPSLVVAITALVLLPTPLNEQLITLLVLIDTAAVLGWQRQQRRWLLTAGAMILVVLHDWPLLWIPFAQLHLLWPWYSLQLAIIACFFMWAEWKLQKNHAEPTGHSLDTSPPSSGILAPLLSWAWKITAGLAVIEWSLHTYSLFTALTSGNTPQWLSEGSDKIAAFGAAGLLLALGARQAWHSQTTQWTYGVALFAGAVGFYIRLILVGLAPASAWDTTAVMIATYALFALYHFVRLEPLFHVVMAMPFLLFATIPFHLASPHAGTAFIAASTLYLLTYRETERSLPFYLALVAFNAAVYLWIPVWVEHYQVIQLYVTPIALSVLLLAHLHRHELKPQVLNTLRLAATTTLYVSATSDVFLHQGLGVFIVALVLSLAGVFLGIAIRVRAFLYAGIASLVCNIGWQLIMLFPEQRLSQAVILLTLAALLAGAMTWFNAQREGILQRVRVFRSDLETWA